MAKLWDNGIYDGTIIAVEAVERKTKEDKKFTQVLITVDTIHKEEVKTLKATMSLEYAKKYFGHCKVKSRDLVGQDCKVSIFTKSFKPEDKDEAIKFNAIRYLNLIDDEGKSILLPKETVTVDIF